MALIDYFRGRALARSAAQLQDSCEEHLFAAVLEEARGPLARSRPEPLMQDLSRLHDFLSSQMPASLLDLPWTPLFCVILFLLHPALGLFSIAAALVLAGLTLGNEIATKSRQMTAQAVRADADTFAEAMRRNAEAVHGLGMVQSLLAEWKAHRRVALDATMQVSDRSGAFTAVTKSLRLLLQSGMLALGALLSLQGAISPGMMIAGTILMGRALAPIEQTIAQWSAIQQTYVAWTRIKKPISRLSAEPDPISLPDPIGRLNVSNIAVLAPGDNRILLAGVSFELNPGDVVGVIGPSGSGKSALARTLVGIWPPVRGEIRLDGAKLDHYPKSDLGKHLGYLPQDVDLLPGTIAQNIARFDRSARSDAIIDAAQMAGAHEMILSFPTGYSTLIGERGSSISGGQRQRIALARAFYGEPAMLVLDEPNSSLDEDGLRQLNAAILRAKTLNATVILMSHRPSALAECSHILLLDSGQMRAFGPRDDILRAHIHGGATVLSGNQQRGRKVS